MAQVSREGAEELGMARRPGGARLSRRQGARYG